MNTTSSDLEISEVEQAALEQNCCRAETLNQPMLLSQTKGNAKENINIIRMMHSLAQTLEAEHKFAEALEIRKRTTEILWTLP
jgi:hypothetical protein